MTAPRAIASTVIEERWRSALRDVERFAGERGISTINSKRYYRANDALEELAAFLVDEVTPGEADASDGLQELMDRLWDEIHDRMTAWAERVEQRRTTRRKVVAA